MKGNLYFLQLTVYQYDKKKIKMDYSCIPVDIKNTEQKSLLPTELQSLVSKEVIHIEKMRFSKKFKKKEYTFNGNPEYIGFFPSSQKEGKGKKISMLYEAVDMETSNEEIMKAKVLNAFRKSFWYSFKYKKFLNKKIKNKQY